MRILSVSSQVAFGPVGNDAVVPALQAKGHEVIDIPTVVLSNHPGHGTPAGLRTAPEDLARILQTLEGLGVLDTCSAALTGYFASAEQIATVATVLKRLKARNSSLYLLVDPVIGDHGRLYVAQEVAEAIRDQLLPLASCVTPNAFELAWLSGRAVKDESDAEAAADLLGISEVLATSVPSAGQLATLLFHDGNIERAVSPRLDQVPNGTGDFLSGLYLASRVGQPAPAAFAAAMTTLDRAIGMSTGTTVLDVAGALHRP